MTPWIKLLLLLTLVTTLSGCATQRQLHMERDLDEMKKRLAKAELSLAAQGKSLTGELEQRLDTLGRTQADLQVALDTLKIDMQSLNGRFEDQARERDELRGDMLLVKDDVGLKLTSLEDRVRTLEENRTAVGGAGGLGGGMPNSPEALYEVALEKIQKSGDYAGARESLQQFLKDNPQHPLSVNAMYWMGEAYFGEKNYENAILQFQDVIQKHPTHPKTPAALFKQGLAFQALGDAQNAKIILRKVQETYPQSEEAGKAKAKLAELK
ncbi:tol-pal system protein YbgF [Trichloromonas sp.]|uniref:tol-pal system protein YbgF n=1 Tax=Trichloromonas sp. TaxID=3069249 RepID=UPI002A405D39|nr:tol-pal system protein YbgF [Trichloromonas sp.]